MVRFSLKGIRKSFSKEERQKKLEARLTKRLEHEKGKYEKYAAHSAEDERINKLRTELKSYKSMRQSKKKKVRIGGFTFKI